MPGDVRTWQVVLVTHVLCGVPASVAGDPTNAADLSLAKPHLLPSVAAVVIGGTSIFGRLQLQWHDHGRADVHRARLAADAARGASFYKQILYGAIIFGLAWLHDPATRRV